MLCKGTFDYLKKQEYILLQNLLLEKILVFSFQGKPKQRENGI
jgi:hypothetical protein